MSDTNLRWLKEVIRQRESNNGRSKYATKCLNNIKKKLLKHLASFKIKEDLVYFVDGECKI